MTLHVAINFALSTVIVENLIAVMLWLAALITHSLLSIKSRFLEIFKEPLYYAALCKESLRLRTLKYPTAFCAQSFAVLHKESLRLHALKYQTAFCAQCLFYLTAAPRTVMFRYFAQRIVTFTHSLCCYVYIYAFYAHCSAVVHKESLRLRTLKYLTSFYA